MNEQLHRLLDLCEAPREVAVGLPVACDDRLQPIWCRFETGAYGFMSALHLFGCRATIHDSSALDWNSLPAFTVHYKVPETFFFAEDLFAGQFGLNSAGRVVRLDPETGDISLVAESIDAWAERLLSRHRQETGWPVGEIWQKENGPLPEGYRLIARKPFVIGGDYVSDNLVAAKREVAIALMAQLADQIHSIPDGKQVTLEGWLPLKASRHEPFLHLP